MFPTVLIIQSVFRTTQEELLRSQSMVLGILFAVTSSGTMTKVPLPSVRNSVMITVSDTTPDKRSSLNLSIVVIVEPVRL
jgi:hypothetical protein